MKNSENGADDSVMREPVRRVAGAIAVLVAVPFTVPFTVFATPASAGAVVDDGPPEEPGVGAPIEPEPEAPVVADVAYDVWFDRWGQSVADVPVGADPWGSWDLTGVLESPIDMADQYAMRMRTLLTPAESGTYRFFVSGDDDARLFLNPTGDDPIGAQQIAYVAGWTSYRQFDRFASQRSAWFDLHAGQSYYLEVIGKEGSFSDHFSVAWERQGGFGPTMVPGDVLETTMLGSGGWRTATPSGLPSAPSPMVDPAWQSVEDVQSLTVSWNPVDGAEWYEVRLEGAGEARDAIVTDPTVHFDGLVPDTRYVVEVSPANPAARMPAASMVRVTLPGPYPTPVAPTSVGRPSVSYDHWDTGWWTLTSVPFGSLPAGTGTLDFGFETPPMRGDNHAARIRAVVTPAKSGTYTFFLSADDDARLFLNPDGVDAVGARQIASVAGWTEQYQWDRYQSQRSQTFQLEKGRSYYLEAISVHALGLDHLEVGWSRDGGPVEVVPNHVLSPTPAGGGGWRTDPSSLPAVPGSPTVEASAGVDEVVVGWAAPIADEHHGAPAFYEVALRGSGADHRRFVTDMTATFHGLAAETTYQVTVTAWNDGGPGAPATAEVTTGTPGGGTPGGGSGGVTPDSGKYAVHATGTESRCQGVEMSGAKASIAGGLRTNGTVGLYVGKLTMSGTMSYGVAIQPGSQQGGSVVHEPTPVSADLPYDLQALLDGDLPAGVTVHRHTKNVVLGAKPAKGVHLVRGDVTLPGSHVDLDGVTVLATGVINVSGSSMTASPAAPGLPSLATTSSACGRAAINLSGSSSTWSGAIVAPNGLVRASGSEIVGRGPVVAAAVRISSASIALGLQQLSLQPVVPSASTVPTLSVSASVPEQAAPTSVGAVARQEQPFIPPAVTTSGVTSTSSQAPEYCPVEFPGLGLACLR
jgi:hypothetical protein